MPTPPDVELLNGSLPESFIAEEQMPVVESESESDSDSSRSEFVPLDEAPPAEPVEQQTLSTFNVRGLNNDLVTFKLWSVGPKGQDREVHIWSEGQPAVLPLDTLRSVMEDMAAAIDPNAVVEQVVDQLDAMTDARNKELNDLSNRVLFAMMLFFFCTTFTAIFAEMNRSAK